MSFTHLPQRQQFGNENAKRHGHRPKGQPPSPTYESWRAMRTRVRREKNYLHVKVCERWNKFENFLADMGERPEGTTIDRINPHGDYVPLNCRWATHSEQQKNKRPFTRMGQRRFYKGKCLQDWAAIHGVTVQAIRARIERGTL